uniref:Xylose isomerase-like TIM barrel domain-containing protein n=1 Tax=viral metagenome TaxID=1070528 RepID=A0A6C0CAH7_9ZZZZ
MRKFRIGRHIDASWNFVSAPEDAHHMGCNIMQIFLANPQQTRTKAKSEKQLLEFSHQLALNKLKLVIHGNYTINLCHPINSLKFKSSIILLVKDLDASSIIGKRCIGVIIHMGKNMKVNDINDEAAAKNYVTGLKIALAQTDAKSTIILETGAGQGNEIGTNLNILSSIYWSLEDDERKRIKFCIDTCHIWAAGYDISDKSKAGTFFKMFEKIMGPNKIACFHYNDSKTELGSHVDRHADIGYGKIPIAGLVAIAKYAFKHRIPLILETPLDTVNLKTNKDITFKDELSKINFFLTN